MNPIPRHPLRVQKLFLVALALKVVSAMLSVVFDSPWTLGFGIPLAVMLLYISLGLTRSLDDVSDDKFADSCYYLGFIFTITSIVASLFDLPSIGTHITAIGIRFGAAMVSTVLGLGVRVYLVGFREETSDAIQAVEDSLVDASKRFREQLAVAVDRLKEFDESVNDARKITIERLELQLTDVSKTFGKKLEEVFSELAGQHQRLTQDTGENIHEITSRLTLAIEAHTDGLKAQLSKIEERVQDFTHAVTTRLDKTTFPDDFFVAALEKPVMRLAEAVQNMATDVHAAGNDIKAVNKEFTPTIRAVKKRVEEMEQALVQVTKLTELQEKLFAITGENGEGLGKLISEIRTLSVTVQAASNTNREELQKLIGEHTTTLREVGSFSQELPKRLDAMSAANQQHLRDLAGENRTLLNEVVSTTQQLKKELDATLSLNKSAHQNLLAQNGSVMHEVRSSMEEVARQVGLIAEIARAQLTELSKMAVAAPVSLVAATSPEDLNLPQPAAPQRATLPPANIA